MKMMLRNFFGMLSLATVTIQVLFSPVSKALAQNVTLPPPESGSFSTAFDLIPDGRLVIFTGTEVRIQRQQGSSNFDLIGNLPPEFRGGSDPAFVATGLGGNFFILGTGAGGSKFPNQPFNGSIFLLPKTGGQAKSVAVIPFHAAADFRHPLELFINRGEASFSRSAVERLDLITKKVQTVIDNIPGASSGVGVDRQGNIYTGIGFDPNGARTGEIRRFSRTDINQAIKTQVALNFDSDGVFVAKVLSAGSLVFDQQGDLWVGGGDLAPGGQQGFIAEIDPQTGTVLRRIDPTDGNPDTGPTTFFSIAISKSFSCTIGAVNSFDPNRTFFKIDACQKNLPWDKNE
jgi:DNA-binding beta-propeller fold protein YncE